MTQYRNGIFTIMVTDEWRSPKIKGYRLPESIIYDLVEKNAEYIVFIDTGMGRYTISLEDWQDNCMSSGVDQWQHVPQSRFTRG